MYFADCKSLPAQSSQVVGEVWHFVKDTSHICNKHVGQWHQYCPKTRQVIHGLL